MIFIRYGMVFLAALFISGLAKADVEFNCPSKAEILQRDLSAYFRLLKIPASQIAQLIDAQSGALTISLTTPIDDTRTLDFISRPEFSLSTEKVKLPTSIKGKFRVLHTVSKKEIMLALLQHGRVTKFKENSCSVTALSDRVGVRQNIVAWAEHLNWKWPDGGPAEWNEKYWNRGTPNPGVTLHAAVMDAFLHQDKYSIGCYTATKLVVVQGMLDYYNRVKRDPVGTRKVEEALLVDGDPLVAIEPGRMWSFEKDYDAADMTHRGKLLRLSESVAEGNFIPGDWGYFVNTDSITAQKTGYEGSNALYLGRNLFDDYYNDNNHSYTYEQKIDEVYQWRHGVFSRERDAEKIKPLTPEQQELLNSNPKGGGLLLDVRAVPRFF